MPSHYVLRFEEVDKAQVARVGGKAAQLGELSSVDGLLVPPGLCITVDAFQHFAANVPGLEARLTDLSRLHAEDRANIVALGDALRQSFAETALPDDLSAAIALALRQLPSRPTPQATPSEQPSYAVRSSATAEDLPTASFAGQHDTFLNVVGLASVLEHVRRCWASLFSERAITYRLRNGFDSRKVQMAVVVQQMLFPRASGLLFTADPVTSNRKVSSIEATFGLGEALVSGLVNADVYKVRNDALVAKSVATKQVALHASPAGGTQQQPVELSRQAQPVLTDEQVVRLAQLGRRIEAHFGRPQDIEWCLVDDDFHVVQSRPITTLFPIPAAEDAENRLYISVGHQQMMTDAMRPLGLSLWKLTSRAPMRDAGGRLFVDVTAGLSSPAGRAGLLALFGKSDPLLRDALETVLARGDFLRPPSDQRSGTAPAAPAPVASAPVSLDSDPAIVSKLIARTELSLAALKTELPTKSGPALLDFLFGDLQELRRLLFDPESHQAILAGMEATWWLNEQLQAWLGEKNAADALAQSAPHNVTSEMGLALLDVADVLRPHPEVVAFLERLEKNLPARPRLGKDRADDRADERSFLDELPELAGGAQARDALRAFLEQYGMRCVGEIDVTRPRWSERPSTLVPVLLGNIRRFELGERQRRFEHGLLQARAKAQELLERLRALPDDEQTREERVEETKRRIAQLRTFIGYREYPKYGMVSRYFLYKQALLQEAERLVQARVLRSKEDLFYLTLEELREVVRTHQVESQLIEQRREAFLGYRALTPPRVLTSEGETLSGTYRRGEVPAGALVGLPVSGGVVEGRARVISDLAEAELEAGDILVTACTDPSWTPLFVSIQGLVTEVGGLMTHGSVIAREYGLPAVVGVPNATRLIRDGQRIRVHGTEGYVELLA